MPGGSQPSLFELIVDVDDNGRTTKTPLEPNREAK
jgi:hypothetical protein